MRMLFKPIGFNDSHIISKRSDRNFVFLIQRALLLGLKEARKLNEMQYRQVEAALLEQYRECVKESAELSIDD